VSHEPVYFGMSNEASAGLIFEKRRATVSSQPAPTEKGPMPQYPNAFNTAALRAQALRLAEEFRSLAARPDTTPIEQSVARSADLIIRIAEIKERTIPTDWAGADLAAFTKWGEDRTQALVEEIRSSPHQGADTFTFPQAKAVSDTQRELRRLVQSFELCEWDAWNEACDDLTNLRPLLCQDGRRTDRTDEPR
jgi:hypothetical protein